MSSPSSKKKPLSPPSRARGRRIEEICKKLENDEILRQIPKRITPDLEFSEDEESDHTVSISSPPAIFSPDYDSKDVDLENEPNVFTQEMRVKYGTSHPDWRKRLPLRCLYSAPIYGAIGGSSSELEKKPCGGEEAKENYNQLYVDTLKRIERLGALKKNKVEKSDRDRISVKEDEREESDVKEKVSHPIVYTTRKPHIARIGESAHGDDGVLEVNGKMYKLLSSLGSGGSCTVYAAIEKSTTNMFAIKCVNLSNSDEDIAEGFLKEIEYLKMFQNSDYVIKLYDYEYCGDMLYLVLEKGEIDLAQYLSAEKRKKTLDAITIKFYWSQMLKAVAEIHSQGIIHSDLKPANFLLVSGSLKLIDFGIATSVPSDKTSVFRQTQVGTVNYMSPEAVSCICPTGGTPFVDLLSASNQQYMYKVGVKSDIWSLGCILYDMVYGYTPFSKFKTILSKVQAIINSTFDIPFPDIPDRHLVHVLKMCLVRNPHERASVKDLLAHPYLRETASKDVSELMSQIQALTPRRMSAVADVIKKLSLCDKDKTDL